MNTKIVRIVLLVIGIVVLIASILTDAGIAAIVVGGLITAAAFIWIIIERNKAKKLEATTPVATPVVEEVKEEAKKND